jgi:hypothetical protein
MAYNDQNTDSLQSVLAEVARRSAIDPDFRSLALSDAKAAIAKVGGSPSIAEIKFIDNSGPVKTIPLPDPIITEDLSDFDLEEVAGGLETISGGVTWTRA